MRHLFKAWKDLEPTLQKKDIFLFLDFDGTLSPIVRHPDLAVFPAEGKRALKKITKRKNIKIAVISGRSLSVLKKKVGIKGLIWAGNHGLEFEGPGHRFVNPNALKTKKLIKKIDRLLKQSFKKFPGIHVENKGVTLSVHYRELRDKRVRQAKKIFLEVLRCDIRAGRVRITEGKKVWEVRPPTSWNKGKIVRWILGWTGWGKRRNVLPVYIGDDRTDEDAFRTIRHHGIGIKVVSDSVVNTMASYYVRSPKEVYRFLEKLNSFKE